MGNLGQQPNPESSIFHSLQIIDERMEELSNIAKNLQERLTPILSESHPNPETTEAGKKSIQSPLEGRLEKIKSKIEGNISFLQDLINRLQI